MMTSSVDLSVARVLRMLAAGNGETVETAATAAGITRDTIYRRLKGQGEWKARELAALAEHFGVSVVVFYNGPEGLLAGSRIPANSSGYAWDIPADWAPAGELVAA